MAGGGGKGSSESTTKVELPEWMQEAYQRSLQMSEAAAKQGYVPWTGPDVAAPSAGTVNAMQTGADTAELFGMGPSRDISAELPAAEDFGGGISGYSSLPLYEKAKSILGEKYPGLKDYLDSFFIDPVSGQLPADSPWNVPIEKSSSGRRGPWEPVEPRRGFSGGGAFGRDRNNG